MSLANLALGGVIVILVAMFIAACTIVPSKEKNKQLMSFYFFGAVLGGLLGIAVLV